MKKVVKPSKERLIDICENKVFKSDVFEQLGFSRQPNGSVRKKVELWYKEIGIDLTQLLKSNTMVVKDCPVCGESFETVRHKQSTTCSYSCSNVYFRSGVNGTNRKPDEEVHYRRLCFRYHDKRCVYCGEDKIVAVHHNDHNHDNNEIENLIPLCPTHHQYVHSRYKDIVQPSIDEYIERWKEKRISGE